LGGNWKITERGGDILRSKVALEKSNSNRKCIKRHYHAFKVWKTPMRSEKLKESESGVSGGNDLV